MSEAPSTRRRVFSFSLRSLFVLVTLAAIGLGWVANERRQSRREMEIAERLEASGATVSFTGRFDPLYDQSWEGPSWWRRTLSPMCGARIQVFNISDRPAIADLSSLTELTQIQLVVVDGTQVRDLSPIAELKSLEGISLSRTRVSDLRPLAGLHNLKTLWLNKTPVGDISPLANLKNLTSLYLDGSQVSDVAPLAGLVNLETLWLSVYPQAIDIAPLTTLTNLKSLWLNGTRVEDMRALAMLGSLRELSLDSTSISDVSPLGNLASLYFLDLDYTQVTDLAPLANLKSLTELHVHVAQVSEEQVKMLQKALPNCTIFSDFSATAATSVAVDDETINGLQVDLSNATASLMTHDYDKAIEILTEIIQVNPNNAEAYNLRGIAWKYKGEFDNMIQDCTEAIRISPNYAEAYHNRGRAWRGKEEYDKAIEDFIQATEVDPSYGGAFNSLGWLRATFPDAKYRDGKQAVEYATKACELADWKNAEWVGTLAAAYAEAGDFDKAVEWQTKAIELAGPEDVEGLKAQLGLYQAGRPYRQMEP
jgi:tetratricopeptide (TPR) repeat protein